MNFRLCTGLAALVCMSLASCYPVIEQPRNQKITKAPDQTTLTPDQLKLKEQEAAQKNAAEQTVPENANASTDPTGQNIGNVTPPSGGSKPAGQKQNDYAFANKVPGKEGFVFSPFNNKVVDVRDIPSGTLVQDPTYPASEKKYFRVP